MYHFEDKNHGIHLIFKFQILYKFVFHGRYLHQKYLPCLSDCKNLLPEVMIFHQGFFSHPCIDTGDGLFATIK